MFIFHTHTHTKKICDVQKRKALFLPISLTHLGSLLGQNKSSVQSLKKLLSPEGQVSPSSIATEDGKMEHRTLVALKSSLSWFIPDIDQNNLLGGPNKKTALTNTLPFPSYIIEVELVNKAFQRPFTTILLDKYLHSFRLHYQKQDHFLLP